MDIISHSLWGYGLFGRTRPWLALGFGAMPDLVSFGAFALIRVVTNNYSPGKPPLEIIPGWCFFLYDLSHSLLIASLLTTLVWRWKKSVAVAMLAWPFHILLDIPFHTRYYFPTKLFYPLSNWFFDGIAWSQPVVWFPNIAGVLLITTYRLCQRRRGKTE
jgi:hypothetical protein